MPLLQWSYYATPVELGFRPWALDFAPDNWGGYAFPRDAILDPTGGKLDWQYLDWDPAIRFWALGWDPNLGEWLRFENPSLLSIMAAREFARAHDRWRFDATGLMNRGWLDPSHVLWRDTTGAGYTEIKAEIKEMFELMENDRDRYLAEIHAQADGLAGYVIAFLGIDSERRPATVELIRCGLAIGNLVYMNYKALFRRVRPSRICPGLVTPFGPPRHPAFPSGHSFLGHFIALLLLEIEQIRLVHGELPLSGGVPDPTQPRGKAKLDQVMSTTHQFNGPLFWLADRLAKNRERAGVHYRSDSRASRWLAGAVWNLLLGDRSAPASPPGAGMGFSVTAANMIDSLSLNQVIEFAKDEWVP